MLLPGQAIWVGFLFLGKLNFPRSEIGVTYVFYRPMTLRQKALILIAKDANQTDE